MSKSSASFLRAWTSLKLPTTDQGYTAIRVEGTNAWIYKTPQAAFGLLLAGVSPPSGLPELRHIRIEYKPERLVRSAGSESRLTRCIEVQVDPVCDQATLARVLERLGEEDPSGGYTSEHLVKTLKDAVELVRPAAGSAAFEDVLGAWGELFVVNQLVLMASTPARQRGILAAWESQRGTRDIIDFRFAHARVALEVKTSVGKRIHHFNGYGQVNVPGNMDQGFVASIVVREAEGRAGRTCADLLNEILAASGGNEVERDRLRRDLEDKLELRGPECRDDRYPLAAAPEALMLFPMGEIPKPPEAPNVTEVEWTSDLSALQGQAWVDVRAKILGS